MAERQTEPNPYSLDDCDEVNSVDTRNASLIQYNIVVVFQELRFGQVLYELARNLLPGHPSPLITEIPNQLLVVVYPDRKLQCQFANRRVEVRDNRDVGPGTEPFSQVAVKAVEAASQASGCNIVAYGYNYVVQLPIGQDPGQFIRTRFFKSPETLGDAFGGEVGSVGIKASIKLADCKAIFDIEPVPDRPELIKAHANYHYERTKLPTDANALTEEIQQKYDEFKAAMERL